jgi:hypothetical protein
MASAPPPVVPSAAVAAPAYSAGAPARKKTSPWVWVAVAVVGLFVLLGVAIAGLGFYAVHKAKQAGLDTGLIQRNPGLAVAKMVVAANPDLEVLRLDEGKGLITLREKSTGKTTTVDFEAVKQGRITFRDDKGESFSINSDSGGMEMKSSSGESVKFGTGGEAKVPSWIPTYPGVKVESKYTRQGGDGEAGAFGFSTKDPVKRVLEFYNQGLKAAGLNISSQFTQENGDSPGGMITAEDGSKQRTVVVTVGTESGGTSVALTYAIKK